MSVKHLSEQLPDLLHELNIAIPIDNLEEMGTRHSTNISEKISLSMLSDEQLQSLKTTIYGTDYKLFQNIDLS